jgi:hypothetical protein
MSAYSPGLSETIAIAKQYKDQSGAAAATATEQANLAGQRREGAENARDTAIEQADLAAQARQGAEDARDTATAQAGLANQAREGSETARDVSLEQAGIATQAANTAAAYVTAQLVAATAANANTATVQAGIATAQAILAGQQATNAQGSANTAAGTLAAVQAIGGGLIGFGVGPVMVPRAAELPAGAWCDPDPLARRPLRVITANYQITPDDDLCTLLIESGSVTLTLPLITGLAPWWVIDIFNRSGAPAAVQRAAGAVIGASATSITVPDGTGVRLMRRDATRFERIA